MRTDRDTALLQGLLSIRSLDLAPERFIERALAMLCDNLRFEQGAVLVDGRPVALKGNPDLAGLPRRSVRRCRRPTLPCSCRSGRTAVSSALSGSSARSRSRDPGRARTARTRVPHARAVARQAGRAQDHRGTARSADIPDCVFAAWWAATARCSTCWRSYRAWPRPTYRC